VLKRVRLYQFRNSRMKLMVLEICLIITWRRLIQIQASKRLSVDLLFCIHQP